MKRRIYACPLAALFGLLALSSFVLAQAASATLGGTVLDESSAVVRDAQITVVNLDTGLRRETTTDAQGSFVVPLLSPGRYRVTAERDGFRSAEIAGLDLNVGDNLALRLVLKIPSVDQSVTVSAEATRVSTSPAVSTVVNRTFVGNLPLNGRSFQSLIELTPGLVLTKANSSGRGMFSVNGQRADTNYFTVDGVSANIGVAANYGLDQPAGGTLPATTAAGGTNNLVTVDALEEFRVQTSTYAAEFGRTPGAQMSIVTRSGTNVFHGSLFDYLRNERFDANDWFANRRGLPKSALRQNDFGGVLGGPIARNRSFFFFGHETLMLRQPQVITAEVPPILARQVAPPQLQPFLNAFPIPNGRDLSDGFAEVTASFSNPSSLHATSVRIDHVTGKMMIFSRYNEAPSKIDQRGVGGPPNFIQRTEFNTRTVTAGATLLFTPTMTNEIRANYSRSRSSLFNDIDDFGGAVPVPDSVSFPPFASRQDSLFSFLFIGTGTFITIGKSIDNIQRQINLVDTLSISRGRHQMRMGVDYRRLLPTFGVRNYTLLVAFTNMSQALTGVANVVTVSALDPVDVLFTNASAFAQDTWRMSPRLTISYGVRWEYAPPPVGRDGNDLFTVSGLDDPATMTLAPRGTALWKTTHGNFAPRFGVGYSASDRTVLRGGVGVFRDLGNSQGASGGILFPYMRTRNFAGVPFPFNPEITSRPAFTVDPPYNTVAAFDPNLKMPYTLEWNATIARELGPSDSITVSYVAAAGRQLLRRELLFNPNPNFSRVYVSKNAGTSDYRSLQVQFNRRLSHALQALASYTWAQSLDDNSDATSLNVPVSFAPLDQERGPSDFDVRHSFTGAATYNIPVPKIGDVGRLLLRNWSVDTIWRARSATPFSPIFSSTAFGGVVTSRPDVVPGVPIYLDDPTVPGGRRVNRAAFIIPTESRQGNLPRNSLRGFSVQQVDLSMRRQFAIADSVSLQLRWDVFNVFNRPNFADYTASLTSSQFGVSTQLVGQSLGTGGASGGFNPLYQIGGPRSMQFALRLQF